MGTRWGEFHLRGRWDGEVFTVREAITVDLYDGPPPTDPPLPPPDTGTASYTASELRRISEEVLDLPGAQSSHVSAPDRVSLDVLYDDGTLQAWADETYGARVVVVTSTLLPLGAERFRQ
jgi:hypothetical protein